MTGSSPPWPVALPKPSWFGITAVLLAAVGIPLGLVLWGGWREVFEAASAIGVFAIIAVLVTSLCNYLLRFVRWQYFLRVLGHAVPWQHNLRIYLSGLAFSATPGKIGELVRGVFLKYHGVSYARTFVLFFWDRLSDLAGVLVLALAAGGLLASGYTGLLPGVLLVLILLWVLRPGGHVFSHGLLILRNHLPRRMRVHVRSLTRLRHADARLTSLTALLGGTLGAAAYGAHGIGLYVLALALDAPLGIAEAILVVSVSTLIGAAVLIPGGIGMVEVTSVALLSAQDIPVPQAVALGLVHRLTTFWFAIGLGSGCLITLIRERRHAGS